MERYDFSASVPMIGLRWAGVDAQRGGGTVRLPILMKSSRIRLRERLVRLVALAAVVAFVMFVIVGVVAGPSAANDLVLAGGDDWDR